MRGVLKSHGAALIWHVLACIYVFAIVVTAFDAERTRDVALVWAVGGALLAFTPGFRSMRTAGLVLAALLPVGLLAAEVAVRARFLGSRAFAHALDVRPDPGSFSRELRATVTREGSNAELGVLRADSEFWLRGTRIKTNALGYRGSEFAPPHLAQVRRVAVAGDSFTLGLGVDQEGVWPQVFAKEVSAGSGDHQVQALDFAYFGDRISQVEERLRVDVLRLNVDAIVVGLSRRMCTQSSSQVDLPTQRLTWGRRAHRLVFGADVAESKRFDEYSWIVRHLFSLQVRPRFTMIRDALATSKGNADEPLEKDDMVLDESAIRLGFAEWRRISKDAGIPFVIVWIRPMGFVEEVRNAEEVTKIAGWAAENNLPFIDPSPLFPHDAQSLDYVIFPGDRHPNARAHALFAEALVRFAASDSGKMVFEPTQTSPATP